MNKTQKRKKKTKRLVSTLSLSNRLKTPFKNSTASPVNSTLYRREFKRKYEVRTKGILSKKSEEIFLKNHISSINEISRQCKSVP